MTQSAWAYVALAAGPTAGAILGLCVRQIWWLPSRLASQVADARRTNDLLQKDLVAAREVVGTLDRASDDRATKLEKLKPKDAPNRFAVGRRSDGFVLLTALSGDEPRVTLTMSVEGADWISRELAAAVKAPPLTNPQGIPSPVEAS